MAKPFVVEITNFLGERDQLGRPIVVVDRPTWACGGNLGEAELRNNDGNMCCLGFACQQLGGLDVEDLVGHEMPNELEPLGLGVSPVAERWEERSGDVHNLLTAAAKINDQYVTERFTHKDRERKLMSQALKLGFVFKFIGRRPPVTDD